MKRFFAYALLLGFLCMIKDMDAKRFGSNRTSSRQKSVFFPSADNANELVGFSSFEGGVILGNRSTEVSVDSLFPVSGSMVLNGGKLKLQTSMNINNPFKIGVGSIEAETTDGQTLDFPFETKQFSMPAEGFENVLTPVDSVIVKSKKGVAVGGSVNSVDWSYDGAYVAVAVESDIGVNELQVYWFHDETLTLTAAVDFGSADAKAVRWHPTSYILASGKSSNNELGVYTFSPIAGLSLQDSSNLAGTVSALSWDPTGAHLAVGLVGLATCVLVYDVDGSGNLGSSVSNNFGLLRTVQDNALAFDSLGTYLLVGMEANLTDPECYVLEFTGAALNELNSLELGQTVLSVGWLPDETMFSIGLNGGTDRLRTYRFNPTSTSITEIESLRVGQTLAVNDLQWGPNGNYLVTGIDANTSGHEVPVYFYDRVNDALELVSGSETGADVLCVRWSSDGVYIASGDVDGVLEVANFAQGVLTFTNILFAFNSDIIFRTPALFQGNCVINLGGNTLDLAATASIIVASDSTLRIENGSITGIKEYKILNNDETSVLTLRDITWLQDENITFTQGALRLNGKVTMSGPYVFAYQSMMTSTLQSKSMWKLDTGFTFSYDPVLTGTQDPTKIEMINDTSVLKIDNAGIYDARGLKLKKGSLIVSRNLELYAEQIAGTDFGSTDSQDLYIDVLPGGIFYIMQGILNNRNVASDAWMFQTNTSGINVQSNARLNIFHTLKVSPGYIAFERNARFGKVPTASIVGATIPRGPYFQFMLGS